jgi:hypothetical protein
MLDVSVPCGACGKPVRGGDEACHACGATVGRKLKAALRERLAASHSGYAEHDKKMESARITIAVLSVLFVARVAISFFLAPSEVVVVANLALAVVMGGLWFWSKRAVLPAILSALAIYLLVMAGSALVDPKTIVQGIFMKIVIVAALARGVYSAIAARRLELAR